ncbi:hypothetical protein C0J52_18942 [Blattella germanica]|nr:hypothetical protein C0J52_18942 [Blattella germanica]
MGSMISMRNSATFGFQIWPRGAMIIHSLTHHTSLSALVTNKSTNMSLDKRNRALLVKLFYKNNNNASAALREYRRLKGLRKGPLSPSALRNMMKKFKSTGELGVAPGRGRRPAEPQVIDEIAVAMVDNAAHDSRSSRCARAVSRLLNISWSNVRKILQGIQCDPSGWAANPSSVYRGVAGYGHYGGLGKVAYAPSHGHGGYFGGYGGLAKAAHLAYIPSYGHGGFGKGYYVPSYGHGIYSGYGSFPSYGVGGFGHGLYGGSAGFGKGYDIPSYGHGVYGSHSHPAIYGGFGSYGKDGHLAYVPTYGHSGFSKGLYIPSYGHGVYSSHPSYGHSTYGGYGGFGKGGHIAYIPTHGHGYGHGGWGGLGGYGKFGHGSWAPTIGHGSYGTLGHATYPSYKYPAYTSGYKLY